MKNTKSMCKILIAHNNYQYLGGEDIVVEAEREMLKNKGHEVLMYKTDNKNVCKLGRFNLLANTLWSTRTYREVKSLIDKYSPDIIHVHNTLPLISPSIYWIANKKGIPVFQTVHNYRLSCLNATFLRNSQICEKCLNRIPWRGIVYRCYRNSFFESVALALTLQLHKIAGTYKNKITRYIALNEFCKEKIVQAGIPSEKISVKPNFICSTSSLATIKTGNPLFVGRLSTEKGVTVLMNAIKRMPNIQFDIVGEGPERSQLEKIPNARLLGMLRQDDVLALMSKSPFLIMPSICYENMPRTIVEAYERKTPVIASRIGALKSIIQDGKSGILFECGSSIDLIRKIKWALENISEMEIMGENANMLYSNLYTEDANYKILMGLYKEALGNKVGIE